MITDRLVLVGVAALSAVATAGWMRKYRCPSSLEFYCAYAAA